MTYRNKFVLQNHLSSFQYPPTTLDHRASYVTLGWYQKLKLHLWIVSICILEVYFVRKKQRQLILIRVLLPLSLNLNPTQEEADTRIVLHAIYSANHEHTERLVIHSNDTDVICHLSMLYSILYWRIFQKYGLEQTVIHTSLYMIYS